MTPLVSIVICTYQRETYLRDALESVIADMLDDGRWEVLVVENGESKTIRPLVASFMTTYANIRYTHESLIGLSHARNRGWREAAGEYVHYIDDDVQVETGWLEAVMHMITRERPHGYGGTSYPLYTTPKPHWFRDEYVFEAFYGNTARPLEPTEFVFGMNMGFSRAILERTGGFDPAFGMTGKKIAYSEDLAIQDAIRACVPNAVIYYEPAISLRHVVRPEKMQWRWIIRQWWARGRYGYLIMIQRHPGIPARGIARGRIFGRSILRVGWHTLLFVWSVTGGALRRDRTLYPLPQHYVYERGLRHIKSIARFTEKARAALKD